jgi:amino acid adenylation domain-containing protein
MPTPNDTRQALVVTMLEEMTGAALADATPATSFFDLGYDSLFMAQVATQLQKRFKVKITFRQLMRDHATIGAVAKLLPEQPAAPTPAASPVSSSPIAAVAAATVPIAPSPLVAAASGNAVERIVREQLAALQQIMGQQLHALSGQPAAIAAAPVIVTPDAAAAPVVSVVAVPADDPSAAALVALGEKQSAARLKVYGQKSGAQAEITSEQRRFIASLADRTSRKMPKTKAFVQSHRHHLADPRTAAGYRAEWKEMVFPVVAERAQGSKIWDMDGNTYVDVVNGYGQTMFGHTPSFVTDAVARQLQDGFPIGPQSPLAGEVAELFCRATGHARVTFCNTGSEAVMAAMRLARTVSARDRIVSFAGDYHGQFDEVLVKGALRAGQPGAAPFCPGIPDQSVANMTVLPYGHAESLTWIKAHADEIAAVLVEPIQSRHPGLQPVEFLRELRTITAQGDICLIMDEIVTGFRLGVGGAQAHFGIQGDLATYGKVVGGGMPIGVLAGKAMYMDALDGGMWAYGDASGPEVAPTFFAGTFVRHPIALAAARAVLLHLEQQGPALYEKLAATTAALVAHLNAALVQRGLPACLEHCASMFYFDLSGHDRLASLLYAHMRLLGVHIQEGFPCFLTTAHSAADIAFIEKIFCDSLDALQAQGILKGTVAQPAAVRPLHGPLTEPQQEIYLIAQFGDRASCVYNESITLEFSGDLKPDALHRAVNDLIARHDALRATFTANGQTMSIAATLKIDIPRVDISAEQDVDAAFRALQRTDANTPFDLEAGPLVRAKLVRRNAASHALMLTCHHMVCDGWSMGILLGELSALYRQHAGKGQAELPPAASFLAYAQNRAAETTVDPAADTFWLNQYTTQPSPLELPTDRLRPVLKSYAGATATAHFDGTLQAGLKKAGARANATLFAVLFAGLQVMLGRLAANTDVVLAVPAGGQALLDEQALVGHCVNFLPIRAPFDFNEPFETHLERARQSVFSALDHQDYTLGTLVRRLEEQGRGSSEPLTRVQFNLERIGENLAFDGLTTRMAPNPKGAVHFDLFFNFIEGADGIRLDIDYSEELFDAATIARWIGHLRTLLEGVATNPQTPIADLPLLSKPELTRQLVDLNRSAVTVPPFRCTHERVADQATRRPDATAVIFGDTRLTYCQLNDAAEELAARIRMIASVPGQRVAVLLERSANLPVALLAVWKAGHAYVPLDPTHPEARLSAILATAKVSAVIADRLGHAAVPPHIPVLVPGDPQAARAATPASSPALPADAVAFMIFTSGSTGTPKGVEVLHSGLDNVLCSVRSVLQLTENDHWLALSTIAFDVAQGELFLPLTSGGVVEIATTEDVREGFPIAKRLNDPAITISHATPSLWQILHEAGFQPRAGLRLGYTGEPIARALADKLTAGGHILWNMYAPAETTIWSTVDRVLPEAGVNCVKAPIAHTELFVLDSRQHLAPIGVIGELWIGGAGVAKGYFERPDLTEAAFQMVTLEDGKPRRLYRTGDVASRRADDGIQLHGRRDHQVKLSGYRIELQEIEHVLRRHPAVADCAVAVHTYPDGDRRLVGYTTLKHGVPAAPAAFISHLSALLPPYMVPNLWRSLDALPLNPNGKLDRKALPVVDRAEVLASTVVQLRAVAKPAEQPLQPRALAPAPIVPQQSAAPANDMATRIAAIWSAVLGVADIPHDQPLLALGARSLHLFRIAARMQDQGLAVTARRLMANPTIDDLAAQLLAISPKPIQASQPTAAIPSLRDFKRTPSRVSEAPS